jgi:ATP-dependent DNA helicase RecG
MSTRFRAPRANPHDPAGRLQYLPGVGPSRSAVYEKLGLMTVEDLLRHYPRAYLDARRFVRIADLAPNELLTVSGTIKSAVTLRTRGGRTDFSLALADGSGTLGCYFFGQPFLAKVLRRGATLVVSGIVDPLERRMMNPMFELIEGETERLLHAGRLIPIHPLTKGLTGRMLRQVMRFAVDHVAANVIDPLPEAVRRERDLEPVAQALAQIHFPEDDAALARARRRLAFEELLMLQMVMELRRRLFAESGQGLSTAGEGRLAARVRESLPWALTEDQSRALDEIVADLRSTRPMHRLLLGDVGSGKTVVALLAALHVIEQGHSVAFMAPTEILARQHAQTCARLIEPFGVRVACLTAGSHKDERKAVAQSLANGEPMLLLGTHALLEGDVKIPDLGLAIVDEQHRFGVKQRATLAKKGALPDVLVLTATPIPRTLTLAFFGDLDVSRLRHRPAERGRLVTRVAGEEKLDLVVGFVAKELAAGRQAFVVVPAIEEGGRPVRSAEAEYRRLAAHPELVKYKVGLLHGRMKADDKRAVMNAFAAGQLQVLVSTTVVEVGVDVPNATVMVVMGAESFGLTQLHQLRGRVGRGRDRSVCVLVPGAAASAQARERLEVVATTQDGFKIAEADLRLRGPGELWGVRQSGLPRLKLADLSRDEGLLEEAREAAARLVAADPQLAGAEHAALRARLLEHYREALDLSLAG